VDVGRRRLLAVVASGVGASALGAIAACGRHKAFTCLDTTGLSVEQILPRNTLQYTEPSPNPDKTCSGCAQFVPGPTEDQCGACKVLKGPVHPGGYCKSFVAKG
jgi:hypothetical protein